MGKILEIDTSQYKILKWPLSTFKKKYSASLVISEMQIKPQRDIIIHSLKWLKCKQLTIASGDTDVEQLELSYMLIECELAQPLLDTNLAVSY